MQTKPLKNNLILAAFIACLLLAIGGKAIPAIAGTTYYVDRNNSQASDSNSGTQALPWKTIQKAANTMVAGDTVLVQAGTYSERVSTARSGTAGNPVTFRASGTVIMKGFSIDHDYITVDGFEITNTGAQFSIFVFGSYCQILNNNIHDSSPDAYGEIMLTWYNTIPQNCVIRGNHVWSSISYSGDFPAISLTGKNHLVEGNELGPIKDADVFRPFGSGHIIRRNYIHDLTMSPNSGAHSDIFQVFGDNGGESYNIVFENNLIVNSDGQMFMTSQDGVANIRDWDVRNNIWVNVAVQGNIGMPNFRFYNNVLYNVDWANGFALALYNETWGAANNAKIKNNIFIGPGGLDYTGGVPYVMESGLTGVETDYNYVTGDPSKGYPARDDFSEVHGINGGDPKFVNLAAWDFRLKQGSPAIDKGATLSGFNYDKDGVSRPQGSAWDIGAYEYMSGSTPPDTTPPRPPSGLRVK